MELKCAVQHYQWGKIGEWSEVAQLGHLNSGLAIDNKSCYAELWMGTHPNGQSVLAKTNEPLLHWIVANQKCLGKTRLKDITFLLKVLSVNIPLSIQAHPTKEHAAQLHKKYPDIYKDDNHKPEMAIALTPFEALCGFRPFEDLKYNFENVPELTEVIGTKKVNRFLSDETELRNNLKECFEGLMLANEDVIQNALRNLLRRLNLADDEVRKQQCAALVERLHLHFPNDVGVFGPYFFNYIQLNPGEAIYLGPNEPHAYLSGDCVECMACSDNVVRAGLTPKFKDVNTLCEMLTYRCDTPDSNKFSPLVEDEFTLLFAPPVKDFAVAKTELKEEEVYKLKERTSASIILIIQGSATCDFGTVQRGSVIFLPAENELKLKVEKHLILYQAFSYLM